MPTNKRPPLVNTTANMSCVLAIPPSDPGTGVLRTTPITTLHELHSLRYALCVAQRTLLIKPANPAKPYALAMTGVGGAAEHVIGQPPPAAPAGGERRRSGPPRGASGKL